MTTNSPNSNPIIGTGAPAVTAPEGTIYIDSTNAALGAVVSYRMVGGAWVPTNNILPNTTVAALPAAAAGLTGVRGFVTDANATLTAGIGTAVAAGGANKVPVVCDGTNWKIG